MAKKTWKQDKQAFIFTSADRAAVEPKISELLDQFEADTGRGHSRVFKGGPDYFTEVLQNYSESIEIDKYEQAMAQGAPMVMWITDADEANYRVKELKKAGFKTSVDALEAKLEAKAALEASVEAGKENDQLALF